MLPYIHDVRAAAERLFASPRAAHYVSRGFAFAVSRRPPRQRARVRRHAPDAKPACTERFASKSFGVGRVMRPGRGDAAPLRTACGCFRAVAARARGFPRARAAQRAGDNAFRSIAAALQPMSLAPLRLALLPESWLSGFCGWAASAHLAPDAVAGASRESRGRALLKPCAPAGGARRHTDFMDGVALHTAVATRPAVNGARGLQQMTADLRRVLR